MNKLLLTSICRPIGPRYGDAPSVGYELLHGQVTLAQGLFSPRAKHLQYGLEFIAANLDTPTTVLHYPNKKELIRELNKGYDYVGLSFILGTFHRMKEVVAIIREHSPTTKIVLGGYGTVIEDEKLKPYGDYFCRSEGVDFMKELLGEEPRQAAYTYPTVISKLKVFSMPVGNTGMIFAGLGCPNGCDFCCTSHFFKRKHVRLLDSGRDIFNAIEHYQKIEEGMKITILDEDFLLNKPRAMEFAEAVRESGRVLSIFCFASIRALAQYTTTELIAMGVDGLWIGVEGRRSEYSKQKGKDVAELFAELRSAGILILASMIVGFDYQTPEIIQEELEYLLAQEPTLSQFLIYGPSPGTPFYKRVMEENRLRQVFVDDREKFFHESTGFTTMIEHPTISAEELQDQQQHCFQEDFKRLGPSTVRSLECYLNGFERWRDNADPQLSGKSRMFWNDFKYGIPVIIVAGLLGPSRMARQRAWKLMGRAFRHAPGAVAKKSLLAPLAVVAALWTGLSLKMGLFQHPKLRRHYYPNKGLEAAKDFRWYGKSARAWLEMHLETIRHKEFLPSFNVVQLKGSLDRTTVKGLFRQLKKDHLLSLQNFVLDLRNVEIRDSKAFEKFLTNFRKENDRIRIMVTEEMAVWLKERTELLRQNIQLFLNEESLLAHAN